MNSNIYDIVKRVYFVNFLFQCNFYTHFCGGKTRRLLQFLKRLNIMS